MVQTRSAERDNAGHENSWTEWSLREALQLARKRVVYLGIVAGGRHEAANEQTFLPKIDTALNSAVAAWQPIESAPKDGTTIDLWGKELGRMPDCYWGFPSHVCGEAGQYCDSDWHSLDAGWVDGTFNEAVPEGDFTHWMPLPGAPLGKDVTVCGTASLSTSSLNPLP